MQASVKRSERDTPLQLRYPKWALAWAILLGVGFLVNLAQLDAVAEEEQGLFLLIAVIDAVMGWFIWYGITLAVGWAAHKLWESKLVPAAPDLTSSKGTCPQCGQGYHTWCLDPARCACAQREHATWGTP